MVQHLRPVFKLLMRLNNFCKLKEARQSFVLLLYRLIQLSLAAASTATYEGAPLKAVQTSLLAAYLIFRPRAMRLELRNLSSAFGGCEAVA